MADTAAFFAKKKKGGKKKGFKAFNANKIDVSAVSSTVHVDAPAISSSADGDLGGVSSTMAATSLSTEPAESGAGSTMDTKASGPSASSEQWDDEALAAKMTRGPAVTTASAKKGAGVTELMNMQELESKRREEDDIAERMRVEETKAALAAAKEGMEREAERLRVEQEAKKKAQQDAAIGKPRFGAAAAAVGGSLGSDSAAAAPSSSGKWVPPHMRGGASAGGGSNAAGGVSSAFSSSAGSGFRGGGGSSMGGGLTSSSTYQRKVDTQDENMFPDLATADAIVQQQQKQTQAMPRRTKPGTSAWGAAKKSPPAPSPAAPAPAPQPAPVPKPAPPAITEPPTKTDKPATTPSATASTAAPPAAAPKTDVGAGLKKKKKKKKDLSTFKPS